MSEHVWREAPDVARMLAAADGRLDARRLRLFAAGCVRLGWRSLVDDRSRAAVEVAERFADGTAGEAERAAAERAALAAVGALRDGPSPWRDAVAACREAHRPAPGPMHPRDVVSHVPPEAYRAWVAAAPFPALRVVIGPAFRASVRWRQAAAAVDEAARWYDEVQWEFGRAEAACRAARSTALDRWWDVVEKGVVTLDARVLAAARAAAACCAAGGAEGCWRLLPPRGQMRLLRCVAGNPFRPVALAPSARTPAVRALARGIYEDQGFDRLPALAAALEGAGCGDGAIASHCHHGEHVRGCWVVDVVLGKE